MRTIWKFQLAACRVEVEMPQGAEIIHFDAHRESPTIWAMVDPYAPAERRAFSVFGTGHAIPPGARYVGTYHAAPFVWHVFDTTRVVTLPASIAALPQEAQNAYRLLVREGFNIELRTEGRSRWFAPDNEPLSAEQTMALAELAEHGFGALADR